MCQLTELQALTKKLKLAETSNQLDNLIKTAESNDHSYTQFLYDVMAMNKSVEKKKR